MVKKKIPAETYFGEKKKFLQIVMLKKKKKFILRRNSPSPAPFPPRQKLNGPSLNQFRNKSSNTI